jgi:biopolymer transport protein ExbD
MKIRSSLPVTRATEINIIPLLDVVFAVLAVFILLVAGLAEPQSIGIDLPTRSDRGTGTAKLQPDLLVLSLDRQGNLFLDQLPLTKDMLETEIKTFLAQKPEGIVVLNAADQTVSYQEVVKRLADLRKLAGDRVAIATSVSESASEAPKEDLTK